MPPAARGPDSARLPWCRFYSWNVATDGTWLGTGVADAAQLTLQVFGCVVADAVALGAVPGWRHPAKANGVRIISNEPDMVSQ